MTTKQNECCPPAKPQPALPEDAELYNEQLARLAKALGHPARVAILRILLEKESCVCGEIVEQLPLAQSTVSQHLKQLKDAGLIRGEVDGPKVCYCIEPGMLEQFKALVSAL